MTKPKTLVVGGGVIGLSIAWEMIRRGHQVELFERGSLGGKTSWAAAGILTPANFRTATDPIDRLRGFSHQVFPDWIAELESETGIDVGLRRCGGWYLADTAGEAALLAGMLDYWRELAIECDAVALEELARREPALTQWARHAPRAAAWWTPDEYQIRPPRCLAALVLAARQRGASLHGNAVVGDIRYSADSVQLKSNGKPVHGDQLIICGGAWTQQVFPDCQLASAIIPVRGQILLLKSTSSPLAGIVNFGNRYIVCRDDGHTLIGSCEEEVGFEFGNTDEMLRSLRDFAVQRVPSLSGATVVKAWSGLRPMSVDGFPKIGRVPATQNVYVAAGHYRSGWHLSPATAICLADLATGKSPVVDVRPFRIDKQNHEPAAQY